MMELEEKRSVRSYFRFRVYAKGCKRKHKHEEERNERYKYFDCTKEARDAMNT